MYNKLESIIKSISGNVLVVGLDNSLLEKFDKNNKVNLYSIDKSNPNSTSNGKKRHTNRGKTINIKRLRKYINKKSVDYLICNMDEMIGYYKYFIRDSIYLSDNIIYIYASNKIDKDFIINRYKRYKTEITSTDYKNGYLITIDNKNGNSNLISDTIYFIKDTFYNIAEFIGNILVN